MTLSHDLGRHTSKGPLPLFWHCKPHRHVQKAAGSCGWLFWVCLSAPSLCLDLVSVKAFLFQSRNKEPAFLHLSPHPAAVLILCVAVLGHMESQMPGNILLLKHIFRPRAPFSTSVMYPFSCRTCCISSPIERGMS